MDPADAEIPQGQGVDPITRLLRVDRRRLRRSVPQAGSVSQVLDDDNLLIEILLRLPPQPSSLPRASAVCRRWRSILSDPQFLKRFRKHHRNPPLLGFFAKEWGRSPVFTAILDRPDRIPAKRFPVPDWDFMGCRHGLAVLVSEWHRELMVWDPLTSQQHRVNFPPGLDSTQMYFKAAVMCADAEDGHVHGDCFSGPLKLFLIFRREAHAFACVYESGSSAWGDIISVPVMEVINPIRPSILVENALYWLLSGGVILVHNFESQSLGVIDKPAAARIVDAELSNYSYQLLRTKNSGLGLAVLSKLTIQIWERKSNCDGVVGWVLLQEVTPLEGIFPRGMSSDHKKVLLAGYDEDTNVIVLTTWIGNFMLQVDSMQIRNIPKANDLIYTIFSPYTNFYTAGNTLLSTLHKQHKFNLFLFAGILRSYFWYVFYVTISLLLVSSQGG